MRRRPSALAAAAALTLALAGCASADKNAPADSASSSMNSAMTMSGTSASSGGAGAVAGSNSSATSMPGMSNGTATVVSATGATKAVPTQTLATADWKVMKIQAMEMTPVPFYVYNGSSFREIKPTPKTSFHLMVMLSDKRTGMAIPYATVWAEFFKNHKLVYNEEQWDMLSEYMGPHYGNDVTLPGPGKYTLKLLVSAPVAALHVEYNKMWVGRHTVTSTFTWK